MSKLKVLVADSHEVVRLGISFIIRCSEDFEVVGEAGSCSEIIKKTIKLKPDIIVMDVRMGDGSGIEACRVIKERESGCRIIILTSPNDDEAIFSAISAGADGLLLKEFKSEELINAMKMVHEGKSLLDPAITTKVLDRMKNGATAGSRPEALLNPQEQRILALIAEGKTNKEIAQILMLSNNTIKNYVSGILSKLNFSNRAEAAAYAVRHNLMKQARAVHDSHGN